MNCAKAKASDRTAGDLMKDINGIIENITYTDIAPLLNQLLF